MWWQKILKCPESWTALSDEQQRKIYALLPQIPSSEYNSLDTTCHPFQSTIYGEAIKDFIAYISRHIENGADKKAWQDEARIAAQQRKEGVYDQVKESLREEYWGQKSDHITPLSKSPKFDIDKVVDIIVIEDEPANIIVDEEEPVMSYSKPDVQTK